MNLSFDWLNEYIDLNNVEYDTFCNKMTMSGSKVEKVFKESDLYKNIVIGEIIEIKKHENADNLNICTIDIGEEKPLTIITAAKNIKKGQLVPVAKIGAVLKDNTKILKAKFKGIESFGMLLSLKELNFNKEDFKDSIEDGILILENDKFKKGQNLSDALNLNDIIIEFEITSNRADCFSVLGLAREASAVFKKPLKLLKEENKNFNIKQENKNNAIEVQVKSKECKRYMCAVIENVKIAPSPFWLKKRLENCGIRSINNIADLTNYIMLETSQPMHAFDYDKITSKKIIIDKVKEGKFLSLDKKEVDLNNTLCINDMEKPIAISGIIGGNDSKVTNQTKTVLLECAVFDKESIKNTRKTLNISTESSKNFERGLDINNCEYALKKALLLIEKLKYGNIKDCVLDIKNTKEEPVFIELDIKFINKFLDINISEKEIKQILESLSFEIINNKIKVPSFRSDVFTKYDIAEEIARIYGYENIKENKNISSISLNSLVNEDFNKKLYFSLNAKGIYEIITYSFCNPKTEIYSNINENEKVYIKNPLGPTTSSLRSNLLNSMLNTLSFNFKNGNNEVKLFEIGKQYKILDNLSTLEQKRLICGIYGKDVDFYSIKEILCTVLKTLLIDEFEFVKNENHVAYHPYRFAYIYIGGEILGEIGEIKEQITECLNINKKVYVFDIDYNMLFKLYKEKKVKYKPISKFPSITRDLGLLCDDETESIKIEKIFKDILKENLEEIKVFDMFKSEKIGKNKKVLAYNFKLRSNEKTLTDEHVDKLVKECLRELEKINVKLRL